jgi:predicted aldo/keto reductase-like oxidoreductase
MPAVDAARENDMGVFIISPTDKGGRLYDPTPKVAEACAPLHPMLWHDLYLLTRVPGINVLSLGAAEPGNFEEHLKALSYLGTEEGERLVDQITDKLDRCKLEAMGEEYLQQWSHGLPHWDECTEAQINVKIILWLRCSCTQNLLFPRLYSAQCYRGTSVPPVGSLQPAVWHNDSYAVLEPMRPLLCVLADSPL